MILLSELFEDDSEAAKQAKQMGLVSKGFGRWADKSGKVTHVTKNGRLVPVGKTYSTPGKAPKGLNFVTKDKDGKVTPIPARSIEPEKPKVRPRRPNPRFKGTVGQQLQKKVEDEGGPRVPVQSAPTKENPSFEELRNAAKGHGLVTMSEKQITSIRGTALQKEGHKPKGLWLGVGSSWIDWIQYEMPQWKGDNLYSIEVDKSKCLVIETKQELERFNKEYSKPTTYGAMIDWESVGKKYSGILISDYFWEYGNRPGYNWYYTWDVASGCIWKTDAIKSVKQISI